MQLPVFRLTFSILFGNTNIYVYTSIYGIQCIYVYMYRCKYVNMYICIHITCIHLNNFLYIYTCIYACMYGCMHDVLYVCIVLYALVWYGMV